MFKAFNPWDEITTQAALADLLARGGVEHPAVRAAPGWHHLDHPDSFWDIVRERLLSRLRSEEITSVRTDVVFSTAQRPH